MAVELTTSGGSPNSRWDVFGATAELPLRPHETASGEPVWVLSILVAGRVWRWASTDCTPETIDGAPVIIPGGLEVEVEESADVARLDGSEMSVSANGLLPPEDIAALVEAGHDVDDIPAEIALWYSGRTWEERLVVLRGSTWLPEYGTRDEEIALTVESPEYEEHGRLLEPNGVVSSITWTSTKPGDKVDGRIYPLVIGRPDWVPATIYDTVNNRVVLATGQVAATEVSVASADPAGTGVVAEANAVTERRDNLGRWVSTGTYTAVPWGDTAEVISRWMVGYTTGGGGIMDEHGSSYVTGLGDVVRFAMRKSTIPIDEGRWRAIEDLLNQWLIDFWTNDPELTPWEFVRDNLLPLVPVTILHGPRGLYPVWWPYEASPNGATGGAQRRVAEVDVQASGLERVGRVQFERGDRAINELSLEFYPWQGDLWRYRLTYSGMPRTAAETTDTFWASTAPLRAAYVRQGEERRAAALVQSRCIYQRATAEQTLNWWQYDKCRAKRVVAYDDARHRWAWLRPGQVVQLVDDELGIDRLAWVRRRALSVGAVRLQFLLWDHP